MARFIIISFAFMGWGFYELSGGSEFDPVETRQARIDMPVAVEEEKLDAVIAAAPAPAAIPENVTRVALNLTSVNEVLRPEPTLETKKARQTPAPAIEEAVAEAISEEPPTIVLPSLVGTAAVITPVEFGRDDAEQTDGNFEIRAVTGNSVNVRGGPGTGFSVVNRLVRGDRVEILQDPGNGWVRLRPVSGGTEGWMADFLLGEG
ncbi:MAG: SH3 domain-containing protein [Pseudomonadota bacterium]